MNSVVSWSTKCTIVRTFAAVKKYAKGIRGGSLSRKRVKAKESEVLTKLLDAEKQGTIFLKLFEETGLLIRGNREASADMVHRFERFQFEVYHQKRMYQYAWIIHDKSSLYSSNDNQYFKEGKKRSLYSENSKGEVHEIFPSEPLIEVNAKHKEKDNNNAKDSYA